jgi:hypothetical protein
VNRQVEAEDAPAMGPHNQMPLLGLETAFLLVTAANRDFDLGKWFNIQAYQGKIPLREFDAKIISLASAMGINQDMEIKRELEIATSPLALRVIHKICACGEDKYGETLINLNYLLKLAQEKVDNYLLEMQGKNMGRHDETEGDEDSEEEHEIPAASSTYANDNIDSKSNNKIPSNNEASVSIPAAQYLEDIQSISQQQKRPVSANAGKRASQRGESIDQVMQDSPTNNSNSNSNNNNRSAVNSSNPSSKYPTRGRYDEEASMEDASQDQMDLSTEHYEEDQYEDDYENVEYEQDIEDEDIYRKTSNRDQYEDIHDGLPDGKQRGVREERGIYETMYDTNSTKHGSPNQKFDVQAVKNKTSPMVNPSTDWAAENRRLLTTSPNDDTLRHSNTNATTRMGRSTTPTSTNITRPRPSSADPGKSRSRSRSRDRNTISSIETRMRSKSVDQALQRIASLQENYILNYYDQHRAATTARRKSNTSANAAATIKILSKDQLSYMKTMLEDQLRDTVKKADLYHLIQVNLGLIHNYTLIPPRGSIVVAQPSQWISSTNVYRALLAGRVYMNELQMQIFVLLLEDFAKQYHVLYPDTVGSNEANVADVTNTKLLSQRLQQALHTPHGVKDVVPDPQSGDPVLGPKHAISTSWLKKYLIHLRLTKRRPCLSGNGKISTNTVNIQFGATEPDRHIATKKQTIPKIPKRWQDWLYNKLLSEQLAGPYKPREMQKALLGQAHGLTKEDVKKLLAPHPSTVHSSSSTSVSSNNSEDYEDSFEDDDEKKKTATNNPSGKKDVLPAEVLAQEIENRVTLWTLDADGRRDFQHQLNIKLRQYMDALNKANASSNNTSTSSGWSKWMSLPIEQRKETQQKLTDELITEKRDYLYKEERSHANISIDLFTKFLQYNQERINANSTGSTWVEWLDMHLDKSTRSIGKLQEVNKLNKALLHKHKKRKQSMASLVAVEQKLKDISSKLDTTHQLQLQKGIITLRRIAETKGLGQVVLKEDFDKYIRTALAPYVNLDETFLECANNNNENEELGTTAATENMWTKLYKEKLMPLFEVDSKKTVENILQAEESKKEENKKDFNQWLAEKKKREVEEQRKKVCVICILPIA